MFTLQNMVKIKINRKELDKALGETWGKTEKEFAAAMTDQFNRVKWQWQGTTLRRNGELATSPRNIVDTANLRDSLVYERVGKYATAYGYTAPYAGINHEGGKLSNGGEIPARPWVWGAVEDKPPIKLFSSNFVN